MSDVKKITSILKIRPHLLIIKVNSSFIKTLKKIQQSKNSDFIYVEKAKAGQMAAVQLMRISGKRFLWIQGFSNPPTPNFFVKFFLSQTDRIIVNSKEDLRKIRKLGVKNSTIYTVK